MLCVVQDFMSNPHTGFPNFPAAAVAAAASLMKSMEIGELRTDI
jgi:hypothetical protein